MSKDVLIRRKEAMVELLEGWDRSTLSAEKLADVLISVVVVPTVLMDRERVTVHELNREIRETNELLATHDSPANGTPNRISEFVEFKSDHFATPKDALDE